MKQPSTHKQIKKGKKFLNYSFAAPTVFANEN